MKCDDDPAQGGVTATTAPSSSTLAPSSSTLVDGVVWGSENKVRWQSMPEYLNFGARSRKQHGSLAEYDSHKWGGAGIVANRPPRVSVTLSDFLAQTEDVQSPGSCDFGWFTPSVSGCSIEDLLPAAESEPAYATPTYDHHLHPTFIATAFGSTAKTASLSPLSFADGRVSGDVGSPSPEGMRKRDPHAGNGHQTNGHTNGEAKQQQQRAAPAYGTSRTAGGGICSTTSSGYCVPILPTSAPLPVARRTNRMSEINQWHALHRHVSNTRSLAAGSEGSGACTMHLRRSSFSLSTRHFPEKPVEVGSLDHSASRGGGKGDGWGGRGAGLSGRGAASSLLNGSPAPSDRAARRTVDGKAEGAGVGGWEGRICEAERPTLRKVKPKSYAWALTEIRVVSGVSPWAQPRAEYLVVACLGRQRLVAGWRRASDFEKLARVARRAWMSKVREDEA